MSAAQPKPAHLPRVLAVVGVTDYGPAIDGSDMNATCPHCGAQGRYVIDFICDDGTRRGAMSGCFKLFRGSESRTAKLVQEAFSRKADAERDGKKLAGWWADIVAEAEAFADTGSAAEAPVFASRIAAIDARRQAWLKAKGYGRYARVAA